MRQIEDFAVWGFLSLVGMVQYIFFSSNKRLKDDIDKLEESYKNDIKDLSSRIDKKFDMIDSTTVRIFQHLDKINISVAKIDSRMEVAKCAPHKRKGE